jgi:hypothetical protein
MRSRLDFGGATDSFCWNDNTETDKVYGIYRGTGFKELIDE